MLFSSTKKINRILKEMSRLLSEGMSYVYLEVTIKKKLHTQNFDLPSLKSSSPDQVFFLIIFEKAGSKHLSFVMCQLLYFVFNGE